MKSTWNASFTIEAAYIMPVVLMCLFMPIWIGIENYGQIKKWVEKQMQEQTMDVIAAMYRQDYMEEIGTKWNED